MSTAWPRAASRTESVDIGKDARHRTPRRTLAELPSGGDRRDPNEIIDAQNAARVPDLIPVRTERMSQSPFAFFRGTAALMTADLAAAPHSDLLVASCGDAHLANFGFYASPQRDLMFDLNDFDEAAWAPWEWDVKRLAASIVIGGQATGRDPATIENAARAAVSGYVQDMTAETTLSPTERFFTRFDVAAAGSLFGSEARKAIDQAAAHARRNTGERAVRKLTEIDEDGVRRFLPHPPEMTHVPEDIRRRVTALVDAYRRTVTADVALLFEHYAVTDVARRVVGVGSVGTQCYLVLFQDGEGNTLLMQPKQASASVLVEYGGIEQPQPLRTLIRGAGEGARVVSMQRILQALSDPFLGDLRSPDGDFFVRQFHDMKGGIEIEDLDDALFSTYGQACAAVLARAHGQSVTAAAVTGYLGDGHAVTEAIVEWAHGYAALARADFDAFTAAHRGDMLEGEEQE